MLKDPYIREKYTKERTAARKLVAEYLQRFPKDRYQTEVESWRELQIAEHRVYDKNGSAHRSKEKGRFAILPRLPLPSTNG